jgi:crotonobetainyl-CoA:carnitine CoA-transferase CaiB-like acyl-CoA transferase
VDTSILNAAMLAVSAASLRADGSPVPRPHLDRMQLGLHPLYRLYQAADGWLCIAATGEPEWRGLVAALDLGPLAADERFADAAARSDNGAALGELLEQRFRSAATGDLFAALDAHGVPCEISDPTFSLGAFDDPEMRAHGLVVTQQHPKLGRFDHFGTTIDFSDTPGHIFGPPPVVGQHTREILEEHGIEGVEYEKLLANRAVFEELWVD